MSTPEKLSERWEQWFSLLHEIIGPLQIEFRKSGKTYDDIAAELGWTPKQAEDRIRAKCRVTVRQMSDIARVIGCRITARVERIDGQTDQGETK